MQDVAAPQVPADRIQDRPCAVCRARRVKHEPDMPALSISTTSSATVAPGDESSHDGMKLSTKSGSERQRSLEIIVLEGAGHPGNFGGPGRRASWMSAPSLRRARRTAAGGLWGAGTWNLRTTNNGDM